METEVTVMEERSYCVIDDEPDVLEGFCENLRSLGRVIGFSSAEAAMKSFDEGFSPHVTVVDLKMPTLGGLQFIEACRSKNYGGAMILVSGNADKSDLSCALNLGTSGFLEKPFTSRALRDAIQRAEVVENKVAKSTSPYSAPNLGEDLLQCYSSLSSIYYEWIVLVENDAFDSGPTFLNKPADKAAYLLIKRRAENLQRTIAKLEGGT